jgi:hypothetical protein
LTLPPQREQSATGVGTDMRGRKRLGAATADKPVVEVWMELQPRTATQRSGLERVQKAVADQEMPKLTLARRSGCSNATIHKLLSGGMRTCSPSLAVALTEALGLELPDIFVPRSSITTPRRRST